MLIVDSSAIVAILLQEPEALMFFDLMERERLLISALNVFEAETVIRSRLGPEAVREVRGLLAHHRAEIIPFDDAQAALASEAYGRFGKGVHPARLNLVDCAAYALAQSRGAALLFKGDDFTQTDVVAAT